MTFGGYALLPNGEKRALDPLQNERPQPLIETARKVVRRTTMLLTRVVGGTVSRCVYFAAVEMYSWVLGGREEYAVWRVSREVSM